MGACPRDGSSDPTNRNRIQGRHAGAIEHEIETPDTRSDCVAINPAGPEPGAHHLPWEVCLAVPWGLPRRQRRGKARQKSAEDVVAAATKRRGAYPSSRRAKGRIF